MRVFFYLDDLIIMAGSREQAMFCTAQLILHLTKLGFAINWIKSTPIPHQQALYLGVVLDAGALRATLSLACYVEPTAALRRTKQLFVCVGGGVIGKALSKPGRLALRVHGLWLCQQPCSTV